MKKSLIKKTCSSVFVILALISASCATENVSMALQGLEQDEDSMIVLHRDLKVKANTNFTMEEFEKEFFSHDTWEETTIAEYKDGIWTMNYLIKNEGVIGHYYPLCYEFHSDGSGYIYGWPYYNLTTDTIKYAKFDYKIDPIHKSLIFINSYKTNDGQPQVSSYAYKILAVDNGRIVLDPISGDEGIRRSLEPHDRITAPKVEVEHM